MLIYYIVIKPEFLHLIYEVEASVKQTDFYVIDVSEQFGMIIAKIDAIFAISSKDSVERLRKIPAIESVEQEIMFFKYKAPAFNIL